MRINAGGLSELVIGREKEKITLKTYISLGQHCAIIAPRRYGKTTLANAVFEEIKDEYLIVKVDVFNASSVRELCLLLIDAVYHSRGITGFVKEAKDNIIELLSRFHLEVDDVKLGYDLLREKDENQLIQKAFSLAESFAQKYSKKVVVFFDEFGDIDRFGVDVIKKLRSIFQTHKHTTYVFAGSQTTVMNTIFLNKSNAFFNFAALMKIDKLAPSRAEEFLMTLAIKETTFDKNAVKMILDKTKAHPFYLTKLLQEAYISSVLAGTTVVCENDVEIGVAKILSDNSAYFENEWRQINCKKYKGLILKETIGIGIDQMYTLALSYKSQLLRELKDESILDDNKEFVDPFLEIWLRLRE